MPFSKTFPLTYEYKLSCACIDINFDSVVNEYNTYTWVMIKLPTVSLIMNFTTKKMNHSELI